MSRGLFVAMEETVDIPNEENIVQSEFQDLEDKINNQELNESEVEAVSTADAVDKALVAIEELSDIALVMADATDSGEGIPEDAAKIAEVAIEAICSRLNYIPQKPIIPAVESFSVRTASLQATKYSMETIGETIDAIWTAIKRFTRRVWEAIKSLWSKLNDQIAKNEGRINAVIKKITDTKLKNKVVNKEHELNLTSYCEAFNAKDEKGLLQVALNTMSSHESLIEARQEINKNIVKHLDQIMNDKDLGSVVDALAKDLFVNGVDINLGFGHIIKAKEDGDKGSILSITRNKTKVEKAEGYALDMKDLEILMSKAKKLHEKMRSASEHVKEAEHVLKKASDFATKMSKVSDTSAEGKRKAGIMRNIQKAFVVFNVNLPVIDAKLVKASVDLAELSLTGYI
jgi:uncharacterized protein with HEPN domain